jgi:hypothetical protein
MKKIVHDISLDVYKEAATSFVRKGGATEVRITAGTLRRREGNRRWAQMSADTPRSNRGSPARAPVKAYSWTFG